MPMAPTNQMVAAVVTPCMLVLPLSSTPPPRKPTPVTICAATRPDSAAERVKAAPHSSARILSEMDPHGYGNNECQLSVSQCISYGNENANGMQREELQEKGYRSASLLYFISFPRSRIQL